MPRYFFDLRDGQFIPDDTGSELAGLNEARVQAVMLAGALLKDNPGGQFWEGHDWNVEVREGAGPILFTLTFFVGAGLGSAVVGGLGDVVGLSGALAVAVVAPVVGVLVLATAQRSAAWGGRAGDA